MHTHTAAILKRKTRSNLNIHHKEIYVSWIYTLLSEKLCHDSKESFFFFTDKHSQNIISEEKKVVEHIYIPITHVKVENYLFSHIPYTDINKYSGKRLVGKLIIVICRKDSMTGERQSRETYECIRVFFFLQDSVRNIY